MNGRATEEEEEEPAADTVGARRIGKTGSRSEPKDGKEGQDSMAEERGPCRMTIAGRCPCTTNEQKRPSTTIGSSGVGTGSSRRAGHSAATGVPSSTSGRESGSEGRLTTLPLLRAGRLLQPSTGRHLPCGRWGEGRRLRTTIGSSGGLPLTEELLSVEGAVVMSRGQSTAGRGLEGEGSPRAEHHRPQQPSKSERCRDLLLLLHRSSSQLSLSRILR